MASSVEDAIRENRFTLADADVLECPYPAFQALRDEAPVYFDPVTRFYVVTRFADVRRVLADAATFSSEDYLNVLRDRMSDRYEKQLAVYRAKGWVPGRSVSLLDDPRHRQVRAIFENALRAGRIRELDPIVRDIAYDVVDGFAPLGACDAVRDFGVPIPLMAIGLQMGARVDDLAQIKRWSDQWMLRIGFLMTEEQELESVEAEIEAQHYFKPIIDELRQEPNGTMLSDLVNTPLPDGSRLTDEELFAHLMADTFVGGSETTTNSLSAGVRALCEEPALQARLRQGEEGVLRAFAEEVVRLECPVQTLGRTTTRNVDLGGVTIPAGSVVEVRFGAANRDRRQFADPDRLDLDRPKAGAHLAFGSGTHACLGAPLARRELHWGFTALLDRCRNIRFAPDKNDFLHTPHFMLRMLRALHVEFDVTSGKGR
jgi:cytochrome P450